ncbi:MAG: hypothetical protein GY847_01415 [Proteobacteria bacterium]|nr:hypothetical protein [Pseudomonadota bacterium]
MIQDDIRELIRRALLGDSAITDEVGTRIYPTEVALVSNPIFPCICFKASMGRTEYTGKVGTLPVRVWIHTDQDYDLGYAIFDDVFSLFHSTIHRDSNINTVGQMRLGPQELFDGTVYSLVTDWDFSTIGVT